MIRPLYGWTALTTDCQYRKQNCPIVKLHREVAGGLYYQAHPPYFGFVPKNQPSL